MSDHFEASLTVLTSPDLLPGVRFVLPLGETALFCIGRGATNDLVLDEPGVAEQHAQIVGRDGSFVIESSTRQGRTIVNRQRVRAPRILVKGDTIEIGASSFDFDLVSVSEPAPVVEPRADTPANVLADSGAKLLATTRFDSSARSGGDEVKTAFDAVQGLLNTFDLNTLCERILDAAFRLVPAEQGAVQLREGEGPLWTALARSTLGDDQSSAAVSSTVVRHVLETKESVLAMDAGADERFSDAASIMESNVRSLMVVPLLAGDEVLGLLYVSNTSQVGAFRATDLDLMSGIGAGAGLVLSNLRLYGQLEDALARQVEFTRTLEQKVDERTIELREKNVELSSTLARLEATQGQIIAQEKLASLGALAAGVAHEILNPLNLINNFASANVELVDELHQEVHRELHGQVEGNVGELLDHLAQSSSTIKRQGERAGSVVQGMLALSHSTGGRRVPTRLNDLLSTLVSALSHGDGDGVPIELSLDEHIGELELAVGGLSRALLNLLGNAVYAVKARAKQAPAGWSPRVHVRTEHLGEAVRVTIRDNGEGLSPSVRANMFEPFFTTKPPNEGTGLGLAITHDVIVQLHRGSIEVDSEPGQYTEFRVTLPRDSTSS